MSKKGKFEKVVPKKRLAWWKIVLIVLAVLLVIVGAVAGFGWNYFKSLIGEVRQAEYEDKDLSDEELEAILGFVPEDETTGATESVPETTEIIETEATTEAATEPTEKDYGEMGKIINIMLVGQNYRETEPTKLSDTMILCTLNRESNTLTMTSFLRDMYVQLPNYKGKVCGMQRINVAYNLGWVWAGDLGGMEMLDLLIYNNFGVEVDYNIELNFNTVVEIVDLMGGVPVVLNADEAAYMTEDHMCSGSFVEGENLLAGDAALVYARMRKTNAADNDFNRTNRQKYLITQIIKKCTSMSLRELNNMLKSVLPSILTDMSEDEILELSKIAIGMLKNLKIESNQCPADGTYRGTIVQIYGQDAGVLEPNVYLNKTMLMAIAEEGKTVEEALAQMRELMK